MPFSIHQISYLMTRVFESDNHITSISVLLFKVQHPFCMYTELESIVMQKQENVINLSCQEYTQIVTDQLIIVVVSNMLLNYALTNEFIMYWLFEPTFMIVLWHYACFIPCRLNFRNRQTGFVLSRTFYPFVSQWLET